MIHAIRGNPRDPVVRIYRKMGEELVENVRMLYEQVDAQYTNDRPSEERVGSQMAVSSLPYLVDRRDLTCDRRSASSVAVYLPHTCTNSHNVSEKVTE